MKPALLALALLLSTIHAIPLQRPPPTPTTLSELPRLVIYHQTTHDPVGRPISLLPLITQQHIALTHLIVAALHIHANGTVHLNDHPPHHPRFHTLWNETRVLQSAGIKVLGMVGGAARGSFTPLTLDAHPTLATSPAFETAYALLHNAITTHALDGIDLDVEETMSQRGIARLIHQLRTDFGPDFVITLAPVASALQGRGVRNLSGFNYTVLERDVGRDIDFYNAQFYSSFGSLADGSGDYDAVVASGWDPRRVVAGQLTSPALGSGFVSLERLASAVRELRGRYGESGFGGVMGWEYFNGVPGGEREPWLWAQVVSRILRPEGVPGVRITREVAEGLRRAWMESAEVAGGDGGERMGGRMGWGWAPGTAERRVRWAPNVNYLSMVNA